MFRHFGWIALVGIVIANAIYYLVFRREMARWGSGPDPASTSAKTVGPGPVPAWVTVDHQSELQLRSPVLVGFFLAGLVIHGGLQQWWIAPVLSRLGDVPLLLGSIGLTAFNDNAAITYLSTLVPGMTEGMKFAVVSGAITGGGLTVIANAPNPAGQSILKGFFPAGISPLGLFLGALPATVVFAVCFLFLG